MLDVRRVFNPQNTGAVYAGVTAVLILAVAVSQWCFRWQNTTGLNYMALRDVCLAVWAVSGILLAASQVAFVVLAVRRKHYGVLLWAGGILFIVAIFVLLLSMMPS